MTAMTLWMAASLLMVQDAAGADWWDASVAASIERSESRREAWVAELRRCPESNRRSLAYLVAHLPKADLETMPPEVLAKNAQLADQARSEVAWGAGLPDEIYLDAVVPHASLTEPRDPMRGEFHERYLPLVRDCKTPGEAAHRINQALFRDYKVTYNTKRLRTDQCSKESIVQGMATCTGLSIMLVEACRAVGVPARVAGIASWPGRGGNHTWVEVWDNGWHFVGAAEPDEKGLDHAWFVGDASKAIKETPRNAIFATTYKPTGSFFPLAWDARARIPGENVTDRYTGGKTNPPSPPRLMVEVVRGGERVEADVAIVELSTSTAQHLGLSFGPTIDINRHLTCEKPPSGPVLVIARKDGKAAVRSAEAGGERVVRVDLERGINDDTRDTLKRLFAERFGADEAAKTRAGETLAQLPWDESMRAMAWEAYRNSPVHKALREEFDGKRVATKDRESPYMWRHVGEKPAGGWPLVIAMHGGGGAPKQVNDGQWKGMFERYYKDHPEAGGYLYLALRAPNDEWNGFYDDAIIPLVERLIRQFVLFAEVDPDRVFTLGASHGGYGAFVIGPKAPDRFAAVHASAAAPTDGETMGENLRNLPFTWMIGGRDTAYGRAERCQAFATKVEAWKEEFGGYPGGMTFLPEVGHSVPDRDKVAEFMKAEPRGAWPDRVVWTQSDDVIRRFYWVEAMEPTNGGKIVATVKDNVISLMAEKQAKIALWLDAPRFDLSKAVEVETAAGRRSFTPEASPGLYCDSLEERGDPSLAAPARIVLE